MNFSCAYQTPYMLNFDSIQYQTSDRPRLRQHESSDPIISQAHAWDYRICESSSPYQWQPDTDTNLIYSTTCPQHNIPDKFSPSKELYSIECVSLDSPQESIGEGTSPRDFLSSVRQCHSIDQDSYFPDATNRFISDQDLNHQYLLGCGISRDRAQNHAKIFMARSDFDSTSPQSSLTSTTTISRTAEDALSQPEIGSYTGSRKLCDHVTASSMLASMPTQPNIEPTVKRQLYHRLWSAEQDASLIAIVEPYTLHYPPEQLPWDEIHAAFPHDRSVQQIRVRWLESLMPGMKKGKWSDCEDMILRTAYSHFGSRWARIAELIDGRTQRQCRTRWMAILKRESRSI